MNFFNEIPVIENNGSWLAWLLFYGKICLKARLRKRQLREFYKKISCFRILHRNSKNSSAILTAAGIINRERIIKPFIVSGILLIRVLIIIAVDNFLIIPLVVARIVNLHPVAVVIVIIVGAQMAGILGMIISVPVACILKITAVAVYEHLIEFNS